MRSSHIICKVNDLAQAVSDYEGLGFAVQRGDAPNKAINAMIWFEQGPFIELLLAKRAGPPNVVVRAHSALMPNGYLKRLDNWCNQPEGWCDIVLETHETDVQPVVKRLRAQGMKIAGPFTRDRTPPDTSVIIRSQTAFPHNARMPLLMGVYRPNPRPEQITHPNGATGVAKIAAGVEDRHRADWAKVLDQDDPWMELVGDETGVQSVSLNGLESYLSQSLLHGAVIVPAT